MIELISGNLLYLLLLILIAFGAVLITISVHLIPVGGAPAAMAQAMGVGTGTTQLAAGAGLTGLLSTAAVFAISENEFFGVLIGGVSAALMIAIVMLVSNVGYIYGVGIVPASGKIIRDPITKDRQDIYVSKGTEGHGIPTAAFASGVLGGMIGGIGGALIYIVLIQTALLNSASSVEMMIPIAIMLSISIFFINSVIASYNIGGTSEGYYDPKFKKLPDAIIVSASITMICGILCLFIMTRLGGII